mmetsp:Transcript_95353/g.139242  ORF Transcript_95353/g.139242 Transcript_95353/m.139242 type:complete len:195 (-) Transcript_95353:1022-1606(-)
MSCMSAGCGVAGKHVGCRGCCSATCCTAGVRGDGGCWWGCCCAIVGIVRHSFGTGTDCTHIFSTSSGSGGGGAIKQRGRAECVSELCARLRGGAAISRTPRGEFAIDDTPHEISGVSLVVRGFAMEMTVPEPILSAHVHYLLDLLVLQPDTINGQNVIAILKFSRFSRRPIRTCVEHNAWTLRPYMYLQMHACM